MTTELNTIASNSQAVATAESFRPSAYDSPEAQALREVKARSRGWFAKQSDSLMSHVDGRVCVPLAGTAFGLMIAAPFFVLNAHFGLTLESMAVPLIAASSTPLVYSGAIAGSWMRRKRPVEKTTLPVVEAAYQEFEDWTVSTYGLRPINASGPVDEREGSQILGRNLLGYSDHSAFERMFKSVDGDYEVKATLRETAPGVFELLKGHDVDAAKAVRFTPIASTHALTASRTFELPAGEQPKAELSALSMSREA